MLAPLRWGRRGVSLLVTAAAVYVVVSGFEVVRASSLPTSAESARRADAVVVLGAPLTGSVPGSDLAGRLEQALLIFEAGRVPQVIVTGPILSPGLDSRSGSTSLPVAARRWLEINGVPARAISVVSAPDASSALGAVAARLGARRRVVVVTDALDALLVEHLAGTAGLSVQVSPAVGSKRSITSEIGPLWREATAVAVGRVAGYGRVSWAPT